MKVQNILLVNALPLNNGDAALVFSAKDYFVKKGYSVKIATQKFETVKKHYPETDFVQDINDIKILRKVPFFKIFISPLIFIFRRPYMQADVIAGVPGGYLNSYYGIISTLMTFFLAKLFGKTTILLPQSFGPITGKDVVIFKIFHKFIDVFISRDDLSSAELIKLGVKKEKLIQMPDFAFINAKPKKVLSGNKKAAISVRDWKYDERDSEKYQELILGFATQLIEQGFELEFISTCQGLIDYVDDSKIAKLIANRLPQEMKSKVIVNNSYYKFNEFNNYIEKFDLVVGTRLHMCIITLCKGIPAFNISYEAKGKECYSYLNLNDLSVDYNCSLERAKNQFTSFLTDYKNYKKSIDLEVLSVKNEIEYKMNNLISRLN